MTDEEREELVARLLQEDLSDEEKRQVRQLLAEDKDLQAEVRLQVQLRRLAREQKAREEGAVREVFRSHLRQEAKTVPLGSAWLRVAAAAAVLLVAGITLWLLYFRSGSLIAEGVVQLPLYELQDTGMGFGDPGPATGSVVTVFTEQTPAAYEFTDTLKVYLPQLPPAGEQLGVAYDRRTDTYYLLTGNARYQIIKGLTGKRPLERVD